MKNAVSREDIVAAAGRFAQGHGAFLHRTPLWKLPGAALGLQCAEVWLKLEHLQVGGSFKARGMLNRLLANTIPASGVIVASGGNAGIATAAAAQALGHGLFEAGGIDDAESEIAEMRLALAPIARDPGKVIHQCETPPDEAIEQR